MLGGVAVVAMVPYYLTVLLGLASFASWFSSSRRVVASRT